MKQKWVSDLESYADSIPYGDVEFKVVRVNRKTTRVFTIGTETLRYKDNNEAVKDILSFLTGLVDDKHTGNVQFQVVIDNGQISLLAIKNTREIPY